MLLYTVRKRVQESEPRGGKKWWFKCDFTWSEGLDSRERHWKYSDWDGWQTGPGKGSADVFMGSGHLQSQQGGRTVEEAGGCAWSMWLGVISLSKAPLRSLLPKDKYWQPTRVNCTHCHCTLSESTKQQHEESERENRPLTRSPEEWLEFMLCPPELPWRGGVERVRSASFLPLLICPLLLIQHEKHRGSDIIK